MAKRDKEMKLIRGYTVDHMEKVKEKEEPEEEKMPPPPPLPHSPLNLLVEYLSSTYITLFSNFMHPPLSPIHSPPMEGSMGEQPPWVPNNWEEQYAFDGGGGLV